jgi:hypothetical protein
VLARRRATVFAGELPSPMMIAADTATVTAAKRPAGPSLTRPARFAARRHVAPILISSVAIAQKPGALCTLGR